MNKFLPFFGSKHSPFDQPDGALDPRLSDGDIGGDNSGGESGDEVPERRAALTWTQAAAECVRTCANVCELVAN